MNELIRVAADVQGFCESRRWRFCFIGGLALQRWGEPRETVDVDLTLLPLRAVDPRRGGCRAYRAAPSASSRSAVPVAE